MLPLLSGLFRRGPYVLFPSVEKELSVSFPGLPCWGVRTLVVFRPLASPSFSDQVESELLAATRTTSFAVLCSSLGVHGSCTAFG